MQVKIVKRFGEAVERDYNNSRPEDSRQRTFAFGDNLKHDYDLEKVTSDRYEVHEERHRGVIGERPLLQARLRGARVKMSV